MATPFATSADVAARWRPLTAAEQTVADTLVGDASALIRARFPGIDASIAAGNLDPDIVKMVVAGMVKRALVAPLDGVSQQSEGTGPYSHSETFANPMRNVFLTAADMVLIEGYKPKAASQRFANDTTQTTAPYSGVYGW
jgi:hypothetical protein